MKNENLKNEKSMKRGENQETNKIKWILMILTNIDLVEGWGKGNIPALKKLS